MAVGIPRRWRNIDDTWSMEFLSLTGSFMSLVIMIALLVRYNNHPVFDWHGVTLNAVVSVLSTASKGWLLLAIGETISQWKWIMFADTRRRLTHFELVDRASRGPLGCVEALLTRTGGIGLSLGAAITILTLAMDPFVQQLIQIQPRVIYDHASDKSAVVPAAKRYSKGFLRRDDSAGRTTGLITAATNDFNMQSSILLGLVSPESLVEKQVQFGCPSGSCKWGPYRSLAVCSSCEGLTDRLSKNPSNQLADIVALLQNLTLDIDISHQVPPPYSIPTAFGLPVTITPDPYDLAFLPNGLSLNTTTDDKMVWRTTTKFNESLAFASNNRLFLSATVINITTNESWPNKPFVAYECILYYCVNEYSSQVINGSLSENYTEITSAIRAPQSWQPIFEAVFPSDISVSFDTYSNDTLDFEPNFANSDRTDLMIGDGFNISYGAIIGISAYLKTLFQHQSNNMGNYNGVVQGKWGDDPALLVYSPDATQALYQSQDLNATFRALARSMSNGLRAGGISDTPMLSSLQGQMGYARSYYVIKWPWMALPIALVFLGYLALWIVRSRSNIASVPLWKSCTLATLVRGPSIQDQLKGPISACELHRKADNVYTQLLERNGHDSGGTSGHSGHDSGASLIKIEPVTSEPLIGEAGPVLAEPNTTTLIESDVP